MIMKITNIMKTFIIGFMDSINICDVPKNIIKNDKLTIIFKKLILINVLYVNSFIIILKYVFPNLIKKIYNSFNLNIYYNLVYYFCIFPITIFVMINSINYYNKILDIFYKKLIIKRSSLCYQLSNQIFFQILYIILNLILLLVNMIPYIGAFISNLLLILMNSYYIYDYRCSVYDINYENRKNYFQSNWIYFLGFGFPFLIIKLFFSLELSLIVNTTWMAILIIKSIYINYPKSIQTEYKINLIDKLVIITDYFFKCFIFPNKKIESS